MLAVDTNVIVRYSTRDDDEQFAKANALIGSAEVFVCTSIVARGYIVVVQHLLHGSREATD
jgi:predicted nucleic acid-binding protein